MEIWLQAGQLQSQAASSLSSRRWEGDQEGTTESTRLTTADQILEGSVDSRELRVGGNLALWMKLSPKLPRGLRLPEPHQRRAGEGPAGRGRLADGGGGGGRTLKAP